MRLLRPAALVAAVLAVAAGCGDTDGPVAPLPGGCQDAADGQLAIVAIDLAWSTPCLRAPAGVPLTVAIDNRDVRVNHNLHVPLAPGSPATPLEAGPVTQRLELPPLDPGDYEYLCDIHPTMVGTLEVRPAT